MERLKCLLVHNYEIENGGVSVLNYDFAEFLNNQKWKVTIFSPLAKFYKEKVCFNLEWRFKNLEKLIREADVILINLSPYLWKSYLKTIEFCKKYNKPYFVWFHIVLDKDIYIKRYGKKNFEERKKIIRDIFNNCLCRKIICVSKAVEKYIEDLVIDKEKLITIYPGVKIFRTKKSKIDGDLLYVGRLSEEKNIKVLINVCRRLKRDFPQIKLNIVGSGPEEEKLKKTVIRFNLKENVNFLGYLKREKVFSLYQSHKILLLPSKVESLGLVIVEALSQGIIPIVRKTYGPKEILRDENLFFENNDELYKKIKNVLKNYEKYKYIIFETRKEILSKFDYERNFSLMERIILESVLFKREKITIFKTDFFSVFV